jgi:catechol 2,3-dioxygenase-like lactoylglutathione lyase family enzyme
MLMAFTLDGLDHLVLTVASIDASVDFYTEVLGMEMVLIEGRKSLIVGVQTIKLHQRGHELNPHAAHVMPGSADLCFITTTPLEEVIEYLNLLKVHIEEGPVHRASGVGNLRSIYIRDPDRNLIEISNNL